MLTNFALLCLKSNYLQHALPYISGPVTSVMSGTSALEIMTYNYYRGMIFMGLEMFDEAIESLRKVLSQPSQVIHQVHLDAWERISLLNLI